MTVRAVLESEMYMLKMKHLECKLFVRACMSKLHIFSMVFIMVNANTTNDNARGNCPVTKNVAKSNTISTEIVYSFLNEISKRNLSQHSKTKGKTGTGIRTGIPVHT